MAALESCGSSARGVARVVTGTGGVGTTHLAGAYARARLAEGWPLVAWINAEDIGGVVGGLAEICGELGLASSGDDRRTGLGVRRWLEADGDRCLIVFDNLTDPQLVQPFIPATGRARVIITSNLESAASLGAEVPVGAFTTAEALAFLADRTGLNDEAGARALTAELAGVPLALAHAAGVIAEQGWGYTTYLKRLVSIPVEERPGPVQDGQCLRAVAATLLSLETERSDDDTELRGRVMDLLSVLSPAGVARSLIHSAGLMGLLGMGEATTEMVDRALDRLAAAALITFSFDGSSLAAHRLVRRVIQKRRATAKTLGAVGERAAALLEAQAEKLWPARHLRRAAVRELVKQIEALRGAAGQYPCGDALACAVVRLRWWAVTFLNELKDSPGQAITVARSLAADEERALGSDHPDTLASRDNLAATYRIAGHTEESIALHQQTLAARERTLGAEHPDTLASRNNLARAYRTAGRTDEAITLHQQTLAARERTLGADHPDTLASRNNLARAYRTAGRTDEAITLDKQTLTGRADQSRRDRRKPQPLLTGVEELVIFLSAKGLTPGEVAAHLARAYGVEVSARSISMIADRAMDGMAQWRNRPLKPAYEVIFIDITQVKIRASGLANLPVHVALGVTEQGERDLLGLWAGEQGDGEHTEFWRRMLSEIKNRGTREVGMVVGDGIEGLPEAVSAVWGKAILTPSVVHLLRRSPLSHARRASKRDWSEMARDFKPIYLASAVADALDRFAEFAGKWATRYPAIIRLCQDAWPDLVAFLEWDQRTRAMITTNAIETLNARFGRSVRARGRFPSEQAALRHLYLVFTNLDPAGRAEARWTNRWNKALPALNSRPVSAPPVRRS